MRRRLVTIRVAFKVSRELIESLEPAVVQSYLIARGWSVSDYRFWGALDETVEFDHNHYHGERLLLLTSKKYGDYVVRMCELIQVLSVCEQRVPSDIIKDMLKFK